MKRVRQEEGEEKTGALFVFHDAPCVHAGNMRRPDYWSFRNQCLELYAERQRICASAKNTTVCLKRDPNGTARRLLAHDLVLQRLGAAEGGLTHAALEQELRTIEAKEPLTGAAVRVSNRLTHEDMARFNQRLAQFRSDVTERAEYWTQTAVRFKRHLYKVIVDCDCFLCVDPSGSLETEGCAACYLCAIRPPQRDDAPSWHAARMCEPCCSLARKNGLCNFCWGLMESDGMKCRGRADFRREREVVHSLSESSVFEILF